VATLSLKAKIYLFTTIALGVLICAWQLPDWSGSRAWLFWGGVIAASLTQMFQVRGLVPSSFYNASILIYSGAMFSLGRPEAVWIAALSNVPAWLRKFKGIPWYAQAFNIGTLVIPLSAADLVRQILTPGPNPTGLLSIVSVIATAAVFIILNHLLVGGIHWLAEGKRLGESGLFDRLYVSADLILFGMGAAAAWMWPINPYAVLLIVSPLYLVYLTFQLPALQRQAESDSKTGLFNARHFTQALSKELERADRFDRPLSVIMCDLDYMRNINNTYGHLAGDAVLTGIAALLRRSVREYDVVARFGGEEFAFLLLEATPEDVFPRVDSIRAAIEVASFTVSTSPTPLKATMSFGIAGRLRPGQTAEEILHNADQALYQAKRAGRNRVCLYVETAQDGAGAAPGPRAAGKRESSPETPPSLGRDRYQAAAL